MGAPQRPDGKGLQQATTRLMRKTLQLRCSSFLERRTLGSCQQESQFRVDFKGKHGKIEIDCFVGLQLLQLM
jgi:hypothetical protein